MLNVTKNLKNLEPTHFARGGFAVLRKATLISVDGRRDQIVSSTRGLFFDQTLIWIELSITIQVAVKFPSVYDNMPVGANLDAIIAKVLRVRAAISYRSIYYISSLFSYIAKALESWNNCWTERIASQHLGFCDNTDPALKEFVGIVLPYCENGNANVHINNHPEVDRLRLVCSVSIVLP